MIVVASFSTVCIQGKFQTGKHINVKPMAVSTSTMTFKCDGHEGV